MTEYLLPVQDDHRRWGFISTKGIVIMPQFDYACYFSEGLAEVKVGDKWGFINHVGEMVIPSQFDCTSKFSEGLASVRIGHQWGAIDSTGNLVIPLQFDLLDIFSEGLSIAYTGGIVKNSKYYGQTDRLVIDGGMWGVVDKTGNFVISPRFKLRGERDIEDMSPPGEGFKNGILNFYGSALISEKTEINPAATEVEKSDPVSGGVKITIEPLWDEESNEWREALLCSVAVPTPTKEIEKYGFINRAGDIVVEPVWDKISDEWHDGLLEIRNLSAEEDGIDEQIFLKPGGEIAFTNNNVNLRPFFYDGMVVATNKEGLMGYVDTHGQLVINCQFYYAGIFSEGLAAVTSADEDKSLYGYINKLGQKVISEQFVDAHEFSSNGLAVVRIPDGKYGLIDKIGQFVLPPEYDWLFAMTDCDDDDVLYEFCEGEEDNTHGVIDREGNVIIEPIYRRIVPGDGLIKAELAGEWNYEPKIYFNKAGEIVFQSTPVVEP
jgi:hypothetical protein